MTAQQKVDLKPLTSDQYRDVIGHFASGVTVITALLDGKELGTTASAFTSLSVEPPMVLVCMNKTSETGKAIKETGRFGVNILGEGHPDLAIRFAGKGDDKFAGVDTINGVDGAPLLVDALAALECTVTETTTGGTHLVFLATVDRGAAQPGSPLAYFRGQFGRFQGTGDEAAMRALRERILNRSLPVGEPLDLTSVSEAMEIDRNTLYHALASLANETGGLIHRNPNGAFEVSPVTVAAMESALHSRATIEIGVATERAGTLTDEELEEAKRLLDVMEAQESGPIEPWVQALEDFLDYFVSLSHNPGLLDVYRRVTVVGMISTARHASDPGALPPPHATLAHRAVLEALGNSDPLGAAKAIERRTEGTIRALKAAIERAGGEI